MIKIFTIFFFIISLSSCKQETENCIGNFSIERIYEAPAPDNISFSTKLSKEYQRKITDTVFSHIIFYLNEKEQFTTHDVSIDVKKDSCFFRMRTTYFLLKGTRRTVSEFHEWIKKSKIKIEFVYDKTGETFFFSKCD